MVDNACYIISYQIIAVARAYIRQVKRCRKADTSTEINSALERSWYAFYLKVRALFSIRVSCRIPD